MDTTESETDAFARLAAAVEAIDPETLRELAIQIDRARTKKDWERLRAHHDINDERVAVTAFEYQAGVVAREEGILAWDCNERHFISPAAQDVHPNLTPDAYWARLEMGRLQSPSMWPFRDDAVMADYTGYGLPRWWSHGLVHALIGFAWWPDLTEMDVVHTARFSESFAAWHWYWLCDLGRDYCPLHQGHIARRDYGMCQDCNALEMDVGKPSVRAKRIRSDFGGWLASSGLVFLLNEVESLRLGLVEGRLVVPPFGTSLGLGEAADYAVWHHRRLRGRGFRRWLDHCAEPGRDYADSPEAFAARGRSVLERLQQWRPPNGTAAPRRGRRVLQDVGYRLCMAAARAGDANRHEEALVVVGDAVRELSAEPDDDAAEVLLANALAVSSESWEREAPPEERETTRLFALGYRPTRKAESEPDACRRDRIEAVRAVMRSRHMPPLFESLAQLVVDSPRRPSDLTGDLMERSAQAYAAHAAALTGWWRTVDMVLSADVRVAWETGWQFRYSLRTLPDPAEWGHYRLTRNPFIFPVPSIFKRSWVLALMDGTAKMPPPFAEEGENLPALLVGATPAGPLVFPVTDDVGRIWERAERGATLAELVEETSEAAVSAALEAGAFACVWEHLPAESPEV